jgi:hypothetical protein
MKIETFYNSGDELFSIFTRGHVDIDAFAEAVRKEQAKKGSDLSYTEREDIEGAELGHFYMHERPTEETDDEGEPIEDEYPWKWCKPDDAGAVPVTAYKF